MQSTKKCVVCVVCRIIMSHVSVRFSVPDLEIPDKVQGSSGFKFRTNQDLFAPLCAAKQRFFLINRKQIFGDGREEEVRARKQEGGPNE